MYFIYLIKFFGFFLRSECGVGILMKNSKLKCSGNPLDGET